jgi:hypothetical protein
MMMLSPNSRPHNSSDGEDGEKLVPMMNDEYNIDVLDDELISVDCGDGFVPPAASSHAPTRSLQRVRGSMPFAAAIASFGRRFVMASSSKQRLPAAVFHWEDIDISVDCGDSLVPSTTATMANSARRCASFAFSQKKKRKSD